MILLGGQAMNLLLVADDFGGGAGNIMQILAKEITERGDSVTLYLTNLHSQMRYKLENVEIIDAAYLNMDGNWLFIQRKRIKAIRQVVKRKHYDIVISFINNNNTMVCLALWKTNIPIIVSERSNPLEIFPKFPWNWMRTYAYHRADLIAVQFDAFRKFDGERFVDQSFVIPNIILASAYKKTHENKDRISFVSLGRNHPIKQFPKMIDLFGTYHAAGGNGELHLYGSEVDTDATLLQLIKNKNLQDYVFLHSAVRNVHETLIQHDVYLMTSKQEGFPNALSEAMACGLPVIAFKCHEGIKDLVKNGENGFCISPIDEQAFVKSMDQLAKDMNLRISMGKRGIEIASQYDIRSVMAIWRRAIDLAIEKRNGKAQ